METLGTKALASIAHLESLGAIREAEPSSPTLQPSPTQQTCSFDLPLHQPLDSTQPFLSWFSTLEESMERDQQAAFRNQLDIYKRYAAAFKHSLQDIDALMALIHELNKNYQFVDEKSKDIQMACERLLEEQMVLADTSEKLASKLKFIDDYDNAVALFSGNYDSICLKSDFLVYLDRLDDCLAFIMAQKNLKEAEVYHLRFLQCQRRGLVMSKLFVIHSLQGLYAEVKDVLLNKESLSSDPTGQSITESLLYTKFHALSSTLRPLIIRIESHADQNDDYEEFFSDCVEKYANIRRNMLHSLIISQLLEIPPEYSLPQKVSSSFALLRPLVDKELSLFSAFFTPDVEAFSEFFQPIVAIFHDYQRPEILRESRLDVLTFAHSVIEESVPSLQEKKQCASEALRLAGNVLMGEIQQRLVFRAQNYLTETIQSFVPREDEILLLIMPIQMTAERENGHRVSVASGPFASLQPQTYGSGEYYPSVQKVVWLLSTLYPCLPRETFEDITVEAIQLCLEKLSYATQIIISKRTKIDSNLFLAKNLACLRKHTFQFDLDFVRNEELIDLSGLTNVLTKSLKRELSFGEMQRELFAAAKPQVIENTSNIRELVDMELKRVCEELILDFSKPFTESMSILVLKANAFKSSGQGLANMDFMNPEQIQKVTTHFKTTIAEKFTKSIDILVQFIADQEIGQVLCRFIKEKVIQHYTEFYALVEQEYPSKVQSMLMSIPQLAIQLNYKNNESSSPKKEMK